MPELKHIESGKLLCLETKGALREVAKFYQQIEEFVKTRRVPVKGDSLAIIYEDPQTLDREQAHYAAAVELAGDCTGDGEMTVVVQGSMLVACESFQGAPEGIQEVYQKLLSWIHDQGYEISGAPREFYLAGQPLDPTAAITEIQIPIARSYPGDASGT